MNQLKSRSDDEGYLSDGTVTREGIFATLEFARKSDWVTRSVPEQLRDFRDVVELVERCAEDQRGGIPNPELPAGFAEYESDHSKFEPHLMHYVNNRAKDYPDGSRIELDYRSRDPSGPFEMKPDRASAVVRLHDLDRTFVFEEGWDETV